MTGNIIPKSWRAALAEILTIATLAACAAPPPTPVPNPQGTVVAAAATEAVQKILPMAGPTWTLITLNGEAVPAELIFTAEFRASGQLTISGDAACNKYEGTLTLNGAEMNITLNEASMKAACPLDIENLENEYYAMLESVASYSLDGDVLTLFDGAKTATGIYASNAQATSPDPLVGTSWTALSYYSSAVNELVDVMADSEITASFDANGELAGSSGCNTYATTFAVSQNNIIIGPDVSTSMKSCGETVDQQEQAYLAALVEANTFVFVDRQLELVGATGQPLVRFAPAAGQE